MSNSAGRSCVSCGDDIGPVEHTDTEGRPLCPDCTTEDDDEGWACFLCSYRAPGMTLADRDLYEEHMRRHRDRMRTAQRVYGLVYGPLH